MLRFVSIVLGIGLFILWVAGLNLPGGGTGAAALTRAASWMIWLDLAAALCALALGLFLERSTPRTVRMASPAVLCLGLFALWIVGWMGGVAPWLTWWNFGFGCVALLAALGEGFELHVPSHLPMPHQEEFGWGSLVLEEDLFRRDRREDSRGAHSGRGPRDYQRSDLRIEEDVNDNLTLHPEIDATEISVHSVGGVVTMSGSVETRRQRRIAEEIADTVPGVRDVKNELEVRGRRAAGDGAKPVAA